MRDHATGTTAPVRSARTAAVVRKRNQGAADMRFPLLTMLIAPHAGAGPNAAPSMQAAHHEAGVETRHAASRPVHAPVDLLVLGDIPPPLRSALDAHYILHDTLDIEPRRFRAIVASTGTVIDADL